MLSIYVPNSDDVVHVHGIKKGSGIVGTPKDDGVHTHYEGNVYDAENLRDWPTRVVVAAGRHVDKCLTVARCVVESADLIEVGHIDTVSYELTLFDTEEAKLAIQDWVK